jgi:hypothetical protein
LSGYATGRPCVKLLGMQFPIIVSFTDLERSEDAVARSKELAQRLVRYGRISHCSVSLGAAKVGPAFAFDIKIELSVPGARLLARNRRQVERRADLHAALRDAFADATRQLLDIRQHRAEAERRASISRKMREGLR